jgi:hypothetical protein
MKALLLILALVFILGLCAGSSILYLNMDYNSSAILTVGWIAGIMVLVRYHNLKTKEVK